MQRRQRTTPAIGGPDGRYGTLDGLRGIAAVLVAIFHLQQRLGAPAINGYLSVDLFFVLSGFVLTQVYVERFAAGLRPVQFTLERFARFYPLYGVGLVLGVVALFTTASLDVDVKGSFQSGAALLFGAGLLPDPASPTLYPLNGAAWSLFFELAVNFLFALWLWRCRSAALFAIAAAGLAWLAATATGPLYLNLGWEWAKFGDGCARTLFSFPVGILICRLVRRAPRQESPAALILLLLAVAPALIVTANPVDSQLASVAILFPAVVLVGTCLEPPRWARPALSSLGSLSFPLYAVHWPLAVLLKPWLQHLPLSAAIILFLAIALSTAYLAQRLVDEPAQRLVNNWRRRNFIRAAAHITTTAPA